MTSAIGNLLRDAFIVHEPEMAEGALGPLITFSEKNSLHLFVNLLTPDTHSVTLNNFIR